MKERLSSGLVGLILGFLIGIIFISTIASILYTTDSYEVFLDEVPGGFIKILAICSLVPASVFSIMPKASRARTTFPIALLIAIFLITIIALIFSSFVVINSLVTFFVTASLLLGGGAILVIILD